MVLCSGVELCHGLLEREMYIYCLRSTTFLSRNASDATGPHITDMRSADYLLLYQSNKAYILAYVADEL